MRRPRILDLYCGAGGASMGYHRAGFDITGVDIAPQRHYPFDFVQADALDHLRNMLADGWLALMQYDAIHASPPCAAYSKATLSQRRAGRRYPRLIGPTRELLAETGLLYIIENVPEAPLRADLRLCGCQVGLELRRVRSFETNWPLSPLVPGHHHPHPVVSVTGHGTPAYVRAVLDYTPNTDHYRAAMGIEWMGREELREAIPPAYTEHVGRALLTHMERTAAA